ncbi:MAG: CoB--CoM heterodisulfide reductase iron-sulfur subunit A family protein [Candidatus Dormibacteria bacterium]|jgi:heterodisulfide reductase subunit A
MTTAPLFPREDTPDPGATPGRRRIGVYVCHCGGNISDYVDVEQVVAAVKADADVVVARDAMFTCSDATQQEIAQDIGEHQLDGMVVASCSPKLHTLTFRGVARRAGLNPYEYTQVNIREQCSWTHTDDHDGATRKALRLVRAGIAHTRLSEPLEPTAVETVPRVLVIGGGVAGMRAAVGLADLGLEAVLIERAPRLGGWVAGLGTTYPHGADGGDLVLRLDREIRRREAITVLTGAELVAKSGTYGDYQVTIRTEAEPITFSVGQIIVTTGFDSYEPAAGEFGYGIPGVLTLPEFTSLLKESDGPITHEGRPVRSIAYIYCVGSRGEEHPYCSRFCCSAAVHSALLAAGRGEEIRQYHLYRDLRTYGKNEAMLTESRRRGSLYLKFADDQPPSVIRDGDGLRVTARDLLTAGEEVTVAADLVVLVTGMVARKNPELIGTLKLPIGRDGFFNEIHPKLRPVETVVDGVLIAGTCQAPKSVAESVASGLAAVTQAAAVLKRGVAELDPQVAVVNASACTGCGVCVDACPFGAITLVAADGAEVETGTAPVGGALTAVIDVTGCKGCGGCAPVCTADAIDLRGYTDAQVRAMIDGLLVGVAG